MSCPHADTTAVLAAFGEAPDDFEHHLSECSECRDVVAQHLETLSIVEPTLTNATARVERRTHVYAIGFLMAAAALLTVQFFPNGEPPHEPPTVHTPTATLADDFFDDHIDNELASLEMELALFNLEES